MLKFFLLIFLFASGASVYATEGMKYTMSGRVADKENGMMLEYATVMVEEAGIGTLSGEGGVYRLEGIPAGNWVVTVQYLGYSPLRVPVSLTGNTVLDLSVERQSLKLEDVQVKAEYNRSGSSLKIGKTALEHIQPSSLSDVFQLLPGYLSADGNLSVVNQVASRQAGTDRNTALGMAIVSDGTPLSNNGNMSALYGADKQMTDRSTVNSGVDLRLLSTDHLEEVEVIPGISSVKYGDLSSGVVVMKSKSGASPLEMRIKADPCNKLAYAGKGFRLPGQRGTLHVGADVVQAKPDVREQLQKYTRFTLQGLYENRRPTALGELRYKIRGTYAGTLDKDRNDPDLTPAEDAYSAAYNRFNLAFDGGWRIGKGWIDRMELTLSGDYVSDRLTRDKTVSLKGPLPLPLAGEEGEHEGIYLPSEYVSHYRVENKPFNFYGQLSGISLFKVGPTRHRLLVGVESRADKNFGRGALYDPTRPPFPTNSASSRPRSLRSVRGMASTALFAEDAIRYRRLAHEAGVTLGVRLTRPANLPKEYALHGKWFAEPRVNLSYVYSGLQAGEWPVSLGIRAGYGEQVKLPTLDMLYPDRVWFDEIAANYYSQTPENRFLWVNTQTRERANPALKVNRNRKYEVGADARIGTFRLNVTLFRESSDSGFETATNYFSFQYNKYSNPSVLPSGKPDINDFTPSPDTLLNSYSTTVNAARLVKKGVEYRLVLPRIQVLRTEVELNGAYYKTRYDVSLPMQYRPQSAVNGKPYLYAGIYDWNSGSRYQSRFNTNCWIRTHIPRFKLLFSALLQTVWFTTSQVREHSGVPVAYVSPDGVVRPFAGAELADSRFQPLVQKFSDRYFEESRTPISVGLNLKVTKEIGEHLKISFMVNRLWDHNPKYETNNGSETRNWVVPSFGVELGIKI